MLKSLAIWCVLVISASGKPHNADGRVPTPLQAPIANPIYTYNVNCCTTQGSQKPKDEGRHWYAPLGDSNWWVVIVASLTGGVVGWQAWETRKSADAANRNIETIKTKERAKIHLAVSHLHPSVGGKPRVILTIRNKGESNAYIFIAYAGLHISQSPEIEGNGSGWQLLKIHDSIMGAGAISEEEVMWPGHSSAVYTQETINGLGKSWHVHLHGSVGFMDAYDDSWEHKFHYTWRELGGQLYMPPFGHTTGIWENHIGQYDEKLQRPKKPNRIWQWLKKIADEAE